MNDIIKEWKTRQPPECERTTMEMAMNPKENDRVVFCIKCGWNWPFGKDYNQMSASSRFEGHKDSADCDATLGYVVTRKEMLDW